MAGYGSKGASQLVVSIIGVALMRPVLAAAPAPKGDLGRLPRDITADFSPIGAKASTTLAEGSVDPTEKGSSPAALVTSGGGLSISFYSVEGWTRLFAANKEVLGELVRSKTGIRALTDPKASLAHVRNPPDFAVSDDKAMLISMRPERISMACTTAIRYLALYSYEQTFQSDSQPVYVAEALSRDGRWLIVAVSPIGHARFSIGTAPKDGYDTNTSAGKVAAQALRDAAARADPASFTPSLASLDKAVTSYDYGCNKS